MGGSITSMHSFGECKPQHKNMDGVCIAELCCGDMDLITSSIGVQSTEEDFPRFLAALHQVRYHLTKVSLFVYSFLICRPSDPYL